MRTFSRWRMAWSLTLLLFAFYLGGCSFQVSSRRSPNVGSGVTDYGISSAQMKPISLGESIDPKPFLANAQDGSLIAGSPLTMLSSDGSVNASFGMNGFVGRGPITAVARQTSGAYLVLTPLGLHRYSGNGSADLAFAANVPDSVLSLISNDAPTKRTRMIVQSDDRILIMTEMNLVRLTKDGALDKTFAKTGFLGHVNGSIYLAIATWGDSKTYLLSNGSGYATFVVFRLNEDGSRDTSYAGSTSFSNDARQCFGASTPSPGPNPIFFAIAPQLYVQPDGKPILMAVTSDAGIGLVRLKANSSEPDLTFGIDGKAVALTGATVPTSNIGFTRLSNGNFILVAGIASPNAPTQILVSQLDANGFTVPSAFRDRGFVVRTIPADFELSSQIAIGAEDRLILAGAMTASETSNRVAFLALSRDGDADSSFGSNGRSAFFTPGQSRFVALETQGESAIIAAVSFETQGNASAFQIMRMSTKGILDPTFNQNSGALVFDLVRRLNLFAPGSKANSTVLHRMLIGADRSIVLYGVASAIAPGADAGTNPVDSHFLAKVTANGEIDMNFGAAGYLSLPAVASFNEAYAIASHLGGKTLVLARAGAPSFQRIDGNGNVDAAFSERATSGLGNQTTVGAYLKTARDGTIYVIADRRNGNSLDSVLMKFSADGNRDLNFGSSGIVSLLPGTLDGRYHTLETTSEGGILVMTRSPLNGTTIKCFRANGSADLAFGTTGSLSIGNSMERITILRSLSVLPDGSLLASGELAVPAKRINGTVPTTFTATNERGVVVKLSSQGALDPSFGVQGMLVHPRLEQSAGQLIRLQNGGLLVGNATSHRAPTTSAKVLAFDPRGNFLE